MVSSPIGLNNVATSTKGRGEFTGTTTSTSQAGEKNARPVMGGLETLATDTSTHADAAVTQAGVVTSTSSAHGFATDGRKLTT